MIAAILVGSVLLASPGEAPAVDSDLVEYKAAAARIGHDPDSHLKLALWCEAHGLGAERLEHLARAVLVDPRNAAARGLMGLVAYRGRWLPPEVISERVGTDAELAARLAEYNARRAGLADTAEVHWKL